MNTHPINFTPGPSQLYFTVADHMKAAFREGIPSLSHRSKKAEGIYSSVVEGLRELLGIPPDYHVFFTGSATEIWERTLQNLVVEQSFHLVNGSFSQRFYETARQLNKRAEKIEVAAGQGFGHDILIPSGTELIAVTHNETSTGVSLPLEDIYRLKKAHPDALLVADAVSSLPFPDFDYNQIDSVFFSVQKGFGLPAGLGVWMVNNRCIAKAEQLLAQGVSIGSYHTLPSLKSNAAKFQTPETPNLLGMYLLGKVIEDMIRFGIQRIRTDTEYKATLLYHLLSEHAELKPFVTEKAIQSKTVIVVETGAQTDAVTQRLQQVGLQPGEGYGALKKTQLRFANFPTHAREHFELLVDSLRMR